jgi:glycosidase
MFAMRKVITRSFFLLAFLAATPLFAQVDFREETIYFLLTARFNDGDSTNNRPTEWCSYPRPQITDPRDVTWRGDFKGLIERLDYIKDLGFTAIWITPIVQNRSPLDYHGYHAWDFNTVDPRLESPGYTFQTLIDSAHAKGIKVILDVVLNHAGRFGIKHRAEIKYNTDPTKPWGQDRFGNPLQPNPNWQYDGMTPNPDDNKIWSRANLAPMPPPYNQNLALYNFPSKENYVDTSDPNWYHHSGNGFAQGYDDTINLYYRALAGDTPDLNTESDSVRQYLVNAYNRFIDMGIDGMRLDAVKHMSKGSVIYFIDQFKARNPNLFIFGEVAQKRHELHPVQEINPHWYTWRGAVGASPSSGMSVIDFYAMGTFHLFERGDPISGVTAAARYDHLYYNPSELITFLDNHDFGPNNDWNRRFGGTPQNLAACMNFMFTWRGIPCVYYGTEMQFKRGAYTDIHSPSDIERSLDNTGRAYYGDVMHQAPSHPIYQHIKKLNAIRRAVPALQKGSWQWGGNGGVNGVGFIRRYGSSEAVVGLAKDGHVTFNFTGVTNGVYRDAVTGAEVTVTNGTLSFTVAPSSAGIYVLNGPGLIGALGAGYFQTSANPGSGGGSGSSVVTFTPNPAQAGAPLTVTYRGFLSPQPQVNLYWGIDNWQNITTTPMTRLNDSTWRVTVTVPSTAQYRFVCVFNNGQGLWDNNNTADYQVSVTGGSTGGSGITTYFKPPASWSGTPRLYFYETSPSVPEPTWDTSPTMTPHGNGWFRHTIAGVSSVRVIFRDNGTNQIPAAMQPGFLRTQDGWFDGTTQTWSNNPPLSVDEPQKPRDFALLQNYPNPFNPTTIITYTLPTASAVRLTLFDVLGRTVATLVNAKQSAGTYNYTLNTSTLNLSSGVYFYQLQANGTNGQSFVETRKMLLTK